MTLGLHKKHEVGLITAIKINTENTMTNIKTIKEWEGKQF